MKNDFPSKKRKRIDLINVYLTLNVGCPFVTSRFFLLICRVTFAFGFRVINMLSNRKDTTHQSKVICYNYKIHKNYAKYQTK